MEKTSSSPIVRLHAVAGVEGRNNDLVFCGSDAQQHVVFFPGDVQVLVSTFLSSLFLIVTCVVAQCWCKSLVAETFTLNQLV